MILFFVRGEVDSDKFIKCCYAHYKNIIGDDSLPFRVSVVRREGEKPTLDCEGVHFNLSHSKGVAMLGMSHTPIGVDIEKIRPIDYSKFDFIDAESEEEFFEEWTKRESYLKFCGKGLRGLREEIPKDAHFEHFPVWGEYIACVCASEQNIIAYELDASSIEE